MNFSRALEYMMSDHAVSRPSWNGKGMWVKIKNPKPFLDRVKGDLDCPHFYMKTMGGELTVWTPNHCDLLANDWMLLADPVD